MFAVASIRRVPAGGHGAWCLHSFRRRHLLASPQGFSRRSSRGGDVGMSICASVLQWSVGGEGGVGGEVKKEKLESL